jgi:hypothetical protein
MTDKLTDAALFLGALALFLLAGVAVLVLVAGLVLAVVRGIVALFRPSRRDRVTISGDPTGGANHVEGPAGMDPALRDHLATLFGPDSPLDDEARARLVDHLAQRESNGAVPDEPRWSRPVTTPGAGA